MEEREKEIEIEEPTVDEVKRIISYYRNPKALGVDGINRELLKSERTCAQINY